MDLIEHAARALAKEQSGIEQWDGLDPELQEDLKRDVRTVLSALLDATPEVGIPAEKLLGDERGHSIDRHDMAQAWTAMIDGLLYKEVRG